MEYAIIAAGKGERLAEEGSRVPKPLTPLLGIPLIERLIRLFALENADHISVIVNGQSTAVTEHLRTLNIPVRVIIQDTESSLHSFTELIKNGLDDEICLTTVDTVFLPDELRKLISTFQSRTELDGLMAVTTFVDDEKPLYVSTDNNLLIQSFDDTPGGSETTFVSGGIYCLRRKAMQCALETVEKGVTRMRNFQRAMIADGLHMEAFPFSKIIDVDHVSDIKKAEEFLQSASHKTDSHHQPILEK